MNKLKEKWNKFSKSQKVLAILAGICIIAILVFSCTIPPSNKSGDDQSNINQEEQTTESAIEDKSEPEEDYNSEEDEYISPSETKNNDAYSLDSVDALALSLFRENFDYNSYDVSLKTINKVVNVEIIGYELDTSQLSKSQTEYGIYQAGIPSAFDGLADSVKEFYSKAGYDVNVIIKLYDINGILLYTARS